MRNPPFNFHTVYFILLSIKKKEGNHMEPQLRIMICRLAEKMRKNKEYAEVLKLEDASDRKRDAR